MLTSLLLAAVLTQAEEPPTPPPPPPQPLRTLELRGGASWHGNAWPITSRVGLTFETPVLVHERTWMAATLSGDWQAASQPAVLGGWSVHLFDVQAGVRYGIKLGDVFELVGGISIGGGARVVTLSPLSSVEFGFAWRMTGAIRLNFGERVLLTFAPVELSGAAYLLGQRNSETVSLSVTPWLGFGVRI